jgi:carnitine 3-dehydrogenase
MQERARPIDGADVENPCHLRILPSWTDYNDHFNVAYYVRALDEAADAFRRNVLGPQAPAFMTLCSRVDYLREVHGGRRLRFTTQILRVTGGRLHLLQGLYDADSDYLAAIEERIDAPAAPLPAAMLAALEKAAEAHAALPLPAGWGGLSPEAESERQNGCGDRSV